MGLAARALATDPAFPAYPDGLSLAQIGAYAMSSTHSSYTS